MRRKARTSWRTRGASEHDHPCQTTHCPRETSRTSARNRQTGWRSCGKRRLLLLLLPLMMVVSLLLLLSLLLAAGLRRAGMQ